MIVFQKLRYKNFLSTGDKFTEIDFLRNKTTLVVGANGAGKSTMLDALSFALFGKSHRNINKPQLVNSINEKGMRVEVEFTVNNQQFMVVRGLKPAKFEIWKDKVLINQNSHAKEYQKVLEQNILKLTHKSFHQVVVLGSSSFIPFMQLPAYHRREVIEDLLDINVFSKMNLILKEKMSRLKDQVQAKKHEVDIIQTKIDGAKAKLRDLRNLGEEERQKKVQHIKVLEDQIAAITDKIVVEERAIEKVDAFSDLEHKSQRGSNRMSKLENINLKMSHEVNSLSKNIDFFTKNDVCPSCEQDIDGSIKSEKLNALTARQDELKGAMDELAEEIDKTGEELNTLSTNIAYVKEKKTIIAEYDREVSQLADRIESIQDELINGQEHDSVIEAEEQLNQLFSEMGESQDERSALMEAAEYNFVISEMLKDSGFKAKIIKQYLPVMNKLVNHYLQVLDFFVHFDLNEEFRETIRSRHRDSFSYDSFSEGEKQRIDLSLLFTWRQIAKMKNSVSTNLLVLDETFDSSLDTDGVDNLMKILHTLDDKTNVFVISHKGDMLEGKFDSKVEFKKVKNFSRMV